MTHRLLSAALLALLLQVPQFKGGVDVVRFNVVVLDKDRHPIAGLTADDFRVVEDGKALRVAGFEAVTIPSAAAVPAAAPATHTADLHVETVTNHRNGPGRVVVIVMDWTIPNEQPMVTARLIANAAIDALGPNDLAAVVFDSGVTGNRLQGLTANRDRLRVAVASAQMGRSTDVQMTPKGLMRGGSGGPSTVCYCGLCGIQTLAGIADAIAPLQYFQKMILFIGHDLPLAENSPAAHGGCEGLYREEREKLFQAIDRGSVVVHAIDPRGLDTGAVGADAFPSDSRPPSSERLIREGNLKTLSEYTGGHSVVGVNQPERLIPEIFEESRVYYVLAVERGAARGNGRAHSVRFEVTRPGVSVLSRLAYLDAIPERPRKAPTDPLERAVAEVLPLADLPLRMTLAPGTTKNSSVDVTLATPLAASARADVLVSVFDQFSKEVGTERAKVELPAREGDEAEWKMHLNPKPGHYEVRAAVQIGNQVGTIVGYIDVANSARPADTSTEVQPHNAAPHEEAKNATPVVSRSERRSAALDALLAQAAVQVEQYGSPSGGLLLDEKYDQQVSGRMLTMRELKSELLILPDAAEGWVEFRDVLAVDGKPVVDRQDRLLHLFSGAESDPRGIGRRITEEGARYNLNGATTVTRTLNHPMVPLLYLRWANQARSQFAIAENTGDGRHVTFTEVRTPALIGTAGDQPATGDFWIDPATGQVTRTLLRVVSRSGAATVSATIRVRYRRDDKTGLMMPVTMEERYSVRNPQGVSVETIDATAWYSNPRQFKASASEVK